MIRQKGAGKVFFGKTLHPGKCSPYLCPETEQNLTSMKLHLSITLVFFAALTRLLPHPDNFTPIGAMALFGAAYFSRHIITLTIPFIALFVSDLVLNNIVYKQYYPTFTFVTSWWIYAAFGLVMLSGWLLLGKKVTVSRVAAASLIASTVFFLVTNFSVWVESGMYARTGAGLAACYTAGLPFLKNTVLGDLFFSGVLFGAYHWLKRPDSLPIKTSA
jgi:hypothetical protein